jgi:hypothetical protein
MSARVDAAVSRRLYRLIVADLTAASALRDRDPGPLLHG